ncbi:hypothetical protein N0V90_007052 [Kalmusia sp. IMI 367209]|nr:hypothetical protein N0V90_007052 [Kalmusia sp. IMI 367209]
MELAKKEPGLNTKETQLKAEDERLRSKQEVLEKQQSAIDQHAADPEKETTMKKPRARTGFNLTDFSDHDMFPIGHGRIFDEWDMPVSLHSFADEMVVLLRAHEYYKGWLDCAKAMDEARFKQYHPSFCFGIVKDSDSRSKQDAKTAANNVGKLFTWSALCEEHGKSD